MIYNKNGVNNNYNNCKSINLAIKYDCAISFKTHFMSVGMSWYTIFLSIEPQTVYMILLYR